MLTSLLLMSFASQMCLNFQKLKRSADNNKDKTIIDTGDTSQRDTITEYSNTKNYDEYADECINAIFPNDIYLFGDKRLQLEEDKEDKTTLKHI